MFIRNEALSGVAALLACSLAVALSLVPRAHSQAIERNLPPPPKGLATNVAPPNAVPGDEDATPLGPTLTGIVMLGATDTVVPASGPGVDLTRTPRLLGTAQYLTHYLGRPLSKKLIAQIEARVARLYRAAGFPFVSFSTPAQEITGGVLQIRALEFHLRVKRIAGASAGVSAYAAGRVRISTGDAIDAPVLAEDLDWLNRYPFRRIDAVFTPGAALGATDLQLNVVATKPWSVYGGYSNYGSTLSGMDRYFAGAETALPGLQDALAAYQITGTHDALSSGARYLNHAARLMIPTLPRQDIEATISYVETNEPLEVFVAREATVEATLGYRSALSNVSHSLAGEGVLGVEAKRQISHTLFGGASVQEASFDVFQATLGYAGQESDDWGRTAGEITVHLSPGSINDANGPAALAAFSRGRVASATYAYVQGDVTRIVSLPALFGLTGFSITHSLVAQYAAVALPLTEQIGLGSDSMVRGYTMDDGAFDAGVVLRNELHGPPFALLGRKGVVSDQLSPFVLIDAGYGKDQRAKTDATAASLGLGADYAVGGHASLSTDGVWALRSVGTTKSGAFSFKVRVNLSF